MIEYSFVLILYLMDESNSNCNLESYIKIPSHKHQIMCSSLKTYLLMGPSLSNIDQFSCFLWYFTSCTINWTINNLIKAIIWYFAFFYKFQCNMKNKILRSRCKNYTKEVTTIIELLFFNEMIILDLYKPVYINYNCCF